MFYNIIILGLILVVLIFIVPLSIEEWKKTKSIKLAIKEQGGLIKIVVLLISILLVRSGILALYLSRFGKNELLIYIFF